MTASNSTLPIQSFNTLVANQQAAILASASALVDFQEGSILQALIEANAGNSLWIQALMSALLAVTRLQTSKGNDVDTFIKQFGYSRPAAVAASGIVNFSRVNTTGASYIPATTTIVSTSSTSVQFRTVINSALSYYDPTTNSYVLANGITDIDVPVVCTATGISGNINVGQIDTINSPLINVPTVTNSSAFTNGSEAASDTVTKADFVLYLQGLSRATYQAIEFAIVNTPLYGPQIKRYQIIENKNTSGVTQYGFFFVVVDDGTGSPPTPLIDGVRSNIELYRGLAIQYDVIPPVTTTIILVIQLTINTSMDLALQTQVTSNVKAALNSYINGLPIGGTKIIAIPPNTSGFLYFSELYDVIFNADPNIISIANLTANAGTSDIALDFKHVALTSNGNISITYTA